MLYVSVRPLACPPRWLQPDVGDWATTNYQAVKRKPARLTCPGRGACSVPCKRAVRNPPPEPPVVLFAVGSPLLALFVPVGRKRWPSSIKHYKRIAAFFFPLLGSSPWGELTGVHLPIFQFQVEVEALS